MSVRSNGSSDRLLATPTGLTVSGHTLRGWAKLIADRNTSVDLFGIGADALDTATYFSIGTGSDGTTLTFYWADDGGIHSGSVAGLNASLNTWYYIVGSLSGTTLRLRTWNEAGTKLSDTTGSVAAGTFATTFDNLVVSTMFTGEWADAEFENVQFQGGIAYSDAEEWSQAQSYPLVNAGGAERLVWKTTDTAADTDGLNEIGGAGPNLTNTGCVNGASTPTPLAGGVTVAVTGTATSAIREASIVAGAKTIILTLTGDTWLVAAGGLFDAQRQNIINGIDSAQSETNGWDAEVKAKQGVAGVVRTSDTIVTITLDAQAAYNITATETITVTVPSSATTLGLGAVVGSPTFTVGVGDLSLTATSGTYALTGNATALTVARVPTRFYLSSTAAADVTPAFEGGWGRTTEGDRREMSPTKDASAMTDKTVWANGAVSANVTALCRQYVSNPLAAGFTFQTTDTIKCYIRCGESAANDNINRQPICVKVVSNDGSTVQATLLALGHVGPNTTEWIAASQRNKTWADGDALTTGYTTVSGDRLVIEIGAQVSSAAGTSVTGTLRFGSASATDLGEDETGTADDNPWFEVNRTLPFFAGAYTLTAAGGSYAQTGSTAGLLVARKVTATAGTYALTGSGLLFHRGFYLSLDHDDYVVTGSVAGLRWAHQLVSVSGTYALTGNSANLTKASDRIMLAGAGTYALTGQTTALNRGRRMTAVAAAYTLTGQVTGLRWAHRLTAAGTTYTYTGNAVTLHAASPPGSYLLTGNAVGLKWGHRITCASGSYALTGQTILFTRAIRMTAVSGTYALNGQAVALTHQSTGAFSLGASPGSFTVTGGTTNLQWGHRLTAETASYAYTGVSVGLLHFAPGGFTITAEGSSYALTGQSVALLRGARVIATSGLYGLTGSALTFQKTFNLLAQRGTYLLTGQDVAMTGPPPVVTFYPGKYRAEWASALVDVREAGI